MEWAYSGVCINSVLYLANFTSLFKIWMTFRKTSKKNFRSKKIVADFFGNFEGKNEEFSEKEGGRAQWANLGLQVVELSQNCYLLYILKMPSKNAATIMTEHQKENLFDKLIRQHPGPLWGVGSG